MQRKLSATLQSAVHEETKSSEIVAISAGNEKSQKKEREQKKVEA